ncbi:MAG: Flp pilus assembly complex ATPase component TadA [Candidatus Thermoplasmatota archaeon]|nr:Flp pilus assembly complex ATPase component TadA [Candidatus Thermoplasmatota archaeon]
MRRMGLLEKAQQKKAPHQQVDHPVQPAEKKQLQPPVRPRPMPTQAPRPLTPSSPPPPPPPRLHPTARVQQKQDTGRQPLPYVKQQRPPEPVHHPQPTPMPRPQASSAPAHTTVQRPSLLDKARQKHTPPTKGSPPQLVHKPQPQQGTPPAEKEQQQTQEAPSAPPPPDDSNKEVIEEQTGFGWKALGSKRIIYDHTTHEYVFEVIEPQLTEDQDAIKRELAHLFKMLADIDTFAMTKDEKEQFLLQTIEQIILDNRIYIEEASKDTIYYHIFRDFLGYSRIDILMHDDGIEDISCDGPTTPIFIHHRKYEAIETNIYFDSEQELNSFLVRLCQISGKQISIFSPIVDGKLPDGSRLQATLARTVTSGSTFTIRKFKEVPLTPLDLINYTSLSTEMAAYFWMAIEDGASILFCGGTASGKTTALNALMLFIPASHKIISIEDTREVNIPHKNWVAGTTRKGFAASDESKTGKDIDMFDLIRAALRQRPRVIIVGEVRGKEAYSLFQAMATGHTAYATVHASSIHTLIQRLENPPIELPRALLTSLDVIVFQNAVEIGKKMVRRMTSVTEIIKLDTDTNQLIFMAPYTWVSKTDDRFESSGSSKILSRIKQQNDWTDEQLRHELDNRMLILEWMRKKGITSYKDFGKIIAEYKKFPEKILQLATRDMQG